MQNMARKRRRSAYDVLAAIRKVAPGLTLWLECGRANSSRLFWGGRPEPILRHPGASRGIRAGSGQNGPQPAWLPREVHPAAPYASCLSSLLVGGSRGPALFLLGRTYAMAGRPARRRTLSGRPPGQLPLPEVQVLVWEPG